MDPVEIRAVSGAGYTMEYAVFGDGKVPLVILPGISVQSVLLSAGSVAGAFASFCGTHTVYLFDRKKEIGQGYTVADMAEDTADAMRRLGLFGAHIFGASQGGMIAQYLAIRHPELCGKVALASTAAEVNPLMEKILPEWSALARAGDPIALNRALFARIYSAAYRKRYAAAFEMLLSSGTPKELERFAYLADACLSVDTYADLYKIACPVAVFCADGDETLTPEASRRIANKIGCPFTEYHGYGHAVYDEAPDFREKLLDFFQNAK